VYSPIVPVSKFATKICAPRIVPGMAQRAADAAKPERINRENLAELSGCCLVSSNVNAWHKALLAYSGRKRRETTQEKGLQPAAASSTYC
jgi:hypothetical protein